MSVSTRYAYGLRILILAALFLVQSIAPGWAADACKRTSVEDAATKTQVKGLEDFATNRFDGRLYMSAFDRFAVEDAVAATADTVPQGAIYAVTRPQIQERPDALTLTDLTAAFKEDNDFRPHGIDIYAPVPDTTRLAAINHRYERSKPGAAWRRKTVIEIFDIGQGTLTHRRTVAHPDLCRANSVAFVDEDTLFVSRDHGACGAWGTAAEDVLDLSYAEVIQLDLAEDGGLTREPVTVVSGVGFANGLLVDRRRNWLFVAATRESALIVHELDKVIAGENTEDREESYAGLIRMPGGPDNLTRAPDGSILIAVHPSLVNLGAYRQRWLISDWFDRPPSRIGLISARHSRGQVPTFDVPAETFQAATVAALFGQHTILGSVLEAGLALCPNEWIINPEGE